jgi:hypothetical protein
MTLTQVIGVLGFLFGSGIVLAVLKQVFTSGRREEVLAELGRRVAKLEAESIDAEKAQEAGDEQVRKLIEAAMTSKSSAHHALHDKIEGVERHVMMVETDLARLRDRCDWINQHPSGKTEMPEWLDTERDHK